MVEGAPQLDARSLDDLAETLYRDGKVVVQQAALYLVQQEEREGGEARKRAPGPLELSLVLSDDAHIAALNLEWRGVDAPTDVLSFEMQGGNEEEVGWEPAEGEEEEEGEESAEEESGELEPAASDAAAQSLHEAEEGLGQGELPATLLGDVVISVDTASRQAAERGHSLLDECRVLLVHGVLHLLGYDHEQAEEAAREMAAAELAVMEALGWKSQGLIATAHGGCTDGALHREGCGGSSGGSGGAAALQTTEQDRSHVSSNGAAPAAPPTAQRTSRLAARPEVRLLALDMDGTLLDSSSRVLQSSVDAIRAALARGVTVLLATGKARPAAIKAMQAVGLAGRGLVVGPDGPGIFLQGLTVYGLNGGLIGGGSLPGAVVRSAWTYAAEAGVPLCGFLGESCVAPAMTPEIETLHSRYYEPLAGVLPDVEEVMRGPPVRKLLFMTTRERVDSQLKPHWEAALRGSGAATMQAVPEMLELVPLGFDKWAAMQQLLAHAGLPASAVMAVGDGGNDLTMVANAGIGVAMGNAVPGVKSVAAAVVSDNDAGGVAEAIEKYIL